MIELILAAVFFAGFWVAWKIQDGRMRRALAKQERKLSPKAK